jgi:AcrR family transcriptional regulator
MQVLKDEVRDNIKQAAMKCFLVSGYMKTSMREISREAKLSTGNLYRYYPNKESLFNELVRPVVELFEKKKKPMKDFDFPFLDINILLNKEIMDTLINAHVIYREELFLLFLRSQGTGYENVKDDFIDHLYKQGEILLEKEFGDLGDLIDQKIYLKATSAALVESILVILEESGDDYTFMKNMLQLMELNIKSILRTLRDMRDNNETFRRISDEEINNYIDCIGHH